MSKTVRCLFGTIFRNFPFPRFRRIGGLSRPSLREPRHRRRFPLPPVGEESPNRSRNFPEPERRRAFPQALPEEERFASRMPRRSSGLRKGRVLSGRKLREPPPDRALRRTERESAIPGSCSMEANRRRLRKRRRVRRLRISCWRGFENSPKSIPGSIIRYKNF